MFKNIVKIILFFLFGCSCQAFNESLAPFDDNIVAARKSFEDVYYELVKNGFFDTYYNNNLIVKTKIDDNFAQEGHVFLYLIEWLEKKNDSDSCRLLEALGKYLYIEFYRFVCRIDAQKHQHGQLLRMLKDIYICKVPAFGIILSRMIVLIFMNNLSQQSYEKRREIMAFMLHTIEDQFLLINTGLSEKEVSNNTIKQFIQILQTYVTKEPFIKPSIKKKMIAWLTCLAIISVLVINPGWDKTNTQANIRGKISEGITGIGKMFKGGVKEFGKGLGEGVGDGIGLEKFKIDLGNMLDEKIQQLVGDGEGSVLDRIIIKLAGDGKGSMADKVAQIVFDKFNDPKNRVILTQAADDASRGVLNGCFAGVQENYEKLNFLGRRIIKDPDPEEAGYKKLLHKIGNVFSKNK